MHAHRGVPTGHDPPADDLAHALIVLAPKLKSQDEGLPPGGPVGMSMVVPQPHDDERERHRLMLMTGRDMPYSTRRDRAIVVALRAATLMRWLTPHWWTRPR